MRAVPIRRAVRAAAAALVFCAVFAHANEDDLRAWQIPGRVNPQLLDLTQQADERYAAGDFAASVTAIEAGLSAAERTEDPAIIAFFLNKAGLYNEEAGRTARALERFERARSVNRTLIINTWVAGGDNVAAAYSNLCALDAKLGRKREAQACADERRAVMDERKPLFSGAAVAEPDFDLDEDSSSLSGEDPMETAAKAEADGDAGKAVEIYRAALPGLQNADPGARGRMRKHLGLALGWSGRARDSAEALTQAANEFAAGLDAGDEADCLERASVQERKSGQYASAVVHEAHAVGLAPRLWLARREAAAADAEGAKARREQRDEDALKAYQKALTLNRIIGARAAETYDLIAITGMLQLRKDFSGALSTGRQALAAAESDVRAQGEAWQGVGDALFGSGRPSEAIAAYEKAWRADRTGNLEEAEAGVLWNLGTAWASIDDGKRALLHYNGAARLAEKFQNNKTVDTVRMLAAILVERLEDPDSTEQVWKARLESDRRFAFAPGMADSLMRLGDVATQRGRNQEAVDQYRQALEFERSTGNKGNEIGIMLRLANVLRLTGDPSAAVKIIDDALRLARSTANHDNEVAALTVMALTRTYLGDFPGALRYDTQAVELARRLGDHRQIELAENSLGILYDEIGDYEESLRHYQLALPEAEKAGNTMEVVDILGNIGGTYLDEGDWKSAVAYEQRMLNLKSWGGGVVNLGYAYLQGKDYDKAAELFKTVGHGLGLAHIDLIRRRYARALTAFEARLPADEKEREYSVLLADYSGIGLAQEGLGRYADAAASYRKGQRLLERIRESLSETERLHYLATSDWMFPRLEPHEGMVRVLPFLDEGLRGSLYAAEFTRARVFAEAAARLYGAPQSRLPGALAERERSLDNRIAAAVRRSDSAFKADDKTGFESAERDLGALKTDQAALVGDLRREFPEYASALYPRPVHVEEIHLKPGEVLLEFEVTGPYTKAFVVKDGKVALSYDVRLTRDELGDLVRKYRGYFENVDGPAALAAYDPKLGRRLYRLLLEPAVKAVPPGAQLIIVPDEILGILPFESLVVSLPERLQLPSGAHGPAPAGVRYAADELDIAYAQSATSLTEARTFARRGASPGRALIVADPIFNAADSRLRGTPLAEAVLDPAAVRTMGAVGRTMGLGGGRKGLSEIKVAAADDFLFPRLDKTSVLAEHLAPIFDAEATDSLVGLRASEAELDKLDLSRYRDIVFATHGILDGEISGIREPALVLNQLGNSPPQNGFLTMSKVMGLRLDADVVALTACDTGLGARLTGEGVMGLGRAFQYAGARTVLVSLWNVAEDSTTLFAERFFSYLKAGKTKRQALRRARTDVRRAGYEHPFYWSPFILIGS